MTTPTQQIIRSLKINLLKNIRDLEIDFSVSGLTAIMGVNGSGKSTILHALACCYKPLPDSEQHDWKFREFYTPNTDSLWQGSSFSMFHDYRLDRIQLANQEVSYSKQADRWAPRYERRPARHISFIGIESCVPVIEKEKRQSFIRYTTSPLTTEIANLIKEKASFVMNRDYSSYNIHTTRNSRYIGVEHERCRYSALSMGAGEQRIFHILENVFNAPKYSLILIDEIDLLLHVHALKKLLQVLKERATLKNLQIIFTTHSLLILNLADIVNVRYIYQTNEKTFCLKEIKPDIVYYLTGDIRKPLKIFVEDPLSKTIVKNVCQRLQMSRYVDIQEFGPAANSFTLVSGFLLQGKDLSNYLFLIDGDVYRTQEEKIAAINQVLTGTTEMHQTMREQAYTKILQFNLGEGFSPERYISNLIKDLNGYDDNEIKQAALDIVVVDNDHKYINDILERLGEDDKLSGLRRVIELASKSPCWNDYIRPVEEWLTEKAPQVRN